MNRQAQLNSTPQLTRVQLEDCVPTVRKIPTRRLRWLSVSGGDSRNTGFWL